MEGSISISLNTIRTTKMWWAKKRLQIQDIMFYSVMVLTTVMVRTLQQVASSAWKQKCNRRCKCPTIWPRRSGRLISKSRTERCYKVVLTLQSRDKPSRRMRTSRSWSAVYAKELAQYSLAMTISSAYPKVPCPNSSKCSALTRSKSRDTWAISGSRQSLSKLAPVHKASAIAIASQLKLFKRKRSFASGVTNISSYTYRSIMFPL